MNTYKKSENAMVLFSMRATILLTVLVLMLGFVRQAVGGIEPVTTDLWDVSQGAIVTAHSGVNEYPGVFYDSDIRNMFGYEIPGIVEPTSTLFRDHQSAGTLHYVEWQTPAPIILQSFTLLACHDGLPFDACYRGFSRFTLFAENTVTGNFDIKLFEIFPSNPYGDTPAPANTIIESPYYGHLYLFATVDPIMAQGFRAEFVQFGFELGSASGPRILELDGFGTVVPEPATLLLLGLGGLALKRKRRV